MAEFCKKTVILRINIDVDVLSKYVHGIVKLFVFLTIPVVISIYAPICILQLHTWFIMNLSTLNSLVALALTCKALYSFSNFQFCSALNSQVLSSPDSYDYSIDDTVTVGGAMLWVEVDVESMFCMFSLFCF